MTGVEPRDPADRVRQAAADDGSRRERLTSVEREELAARRPPQAEPEKPVMQVAPLPLPMPVLPRPDPERIEVRIEDQTPERKQEALAAATPLAAPAVEMPEPEPRRKKEYYSCGIKY